MLKSHLVSCFSFLAKGCTKEPGFRHEQLEMLLIAPRAENSPGWSRDRSPDAVLTVSVDSLLRRC
jgi:hypothetical protein